MRNNRNPQNRRFDGLHFGDPFKEWLKGYKRRGEAIKDVTQLSNEVWHEREALFPVRSVPVPGKPGYVTHDRNFFRVNTKGRRISKDLTGYFKDEYYIGREDRVSFAGAHDLGGLLNLAFHYLMVHGVAIYALEWGEVVIRNRSYILPLGFFWVNPATVNFLDSNDTIARQRYSWVAKHSTDYYDYQDHSFEQGELVVFKHPTLDPDSPVKGSMRYLNDLRGWLRFGLLQGKGSIEPGNHSLPVERARYEVSEDYLRRQSIARVKVRRIFKQPVGGVGAGITTYYEVYAFADYKKHLNATRNYLVGEFNKQVLEEVCRRNGIKSSIFMEYRGFAPDERIDNALKEFEKGRVDIQGFERQVKDDYDNQLY